MGWWSNNNKNSQKGDGMSMGQPPGSAIRGEGTAGYLSALLQDDNSSGEHSSAPDALLRRRRTLSTRPRGKLQRLLP